MMQLFDMGYENFCFNKVLLTAKNFVLEEALGVLLEP